MTDDPFAPLPENDKGQNRPNVYDNLLSQSDDAGKVKFNPESAPPPTSAPARPLNPSTPVVPQTAPAVFTPPVQSPVTPVAPEPTAAVVEREPEFDVSKQEESRAARRAADRQRSVAERGALPKIKDTAKETKKFPFVTLALILTALIIGGGVTAAVIYTFTNKSEVGTPSDVSDAMSDTTLPSLNGFSGQKVLELARVEDVTKVLKEEGKEFASQIDFLGDVVELKPVPVSIQDANGNDTPVFAANSGTFAFYGEITNDQKQKLIDLANDKLVAKGYSAFDINNAGSENPFDDPQLFIGGAKTAEDGALMSYNITVTTATGEDAAGQTGVFITFYSSPHIKKGTEDEFKKFVTDSYNATR